jgi:hypothetical protein
VTVVQERLRSTIEKYLKQGEEYRWFSYPYLHLNEEYKNVYFFDRKKGTHKVTGFLVLDQDGVEVERELATRINESFNLYNLLFKRFKSDWGDVVQQDMRKFVAARGHFESLIDYYGGEKGNHSTEEKEGSQASAEENASKVKGMIQQGYKIISDVLAYQDKFLALDLEAIELGQRKRDQQFIDTQIDQEVRRITQEFEQSIFDQYYVQYQSKELGDWLVQFFEEQNPPKELKRSVKKVLRIFKKMGKNVLKNEERLKVRIEDTKNEVYYTQLYKEWEGLLRNEPDAD